MARVAYADKNDADPKTRELFESWEANGVQVLNLYRVIAKTPEIAKQFMRLGNRILTKGKLPPKLRELAILLVGQLAQAPYEFTKHIKIGIAAGLRPEQVDVIPFWRSAKVYDPAERAVLRFTDEVSRGYRASDEAFADLKAHLSEEQITELAIVIGYYEMVCRVLESLQVETESEEFKGIG